MKRKSFNPIISVQKDGFNIGKPVGEWAETKYNLLGLYCDIFTLSMHEKWSNLIYLDLFAGCGFSEIEGSGKLIKSSPLIALSINQKFNKYIFCESNPKLFEGLKQRVNKYHPTEKVVLFNNDCNEIVDKISAEIPRTNSLCFCFVDPFNLKGLHFSTIRKLGKEFRMDFLILIATGMDAKRNVDLHYISEENKVVELFLEDLDWREKYAAQKGKLSFIQFIAKEYDRMMLELGYEEPKEFQMIKMNYKNIPLYHLAFYSKSELGNKFWGEVKKYKNEQTELF